MKHQVAGIIVATATLTLISGCGKSGKKNTSISHEYSLAQLDSIGRAYKPTVGTYGGTINLPLASDPDGFCPALSSSGYSQDVMGYIYEGLITTDPVTLEYKPNLAESWVVSEDGLIWTFKLRQDVLFSDSVKMSADDVLFTFNDVIYNEKLRSPLNYNFRVNEKKIEVTKIDQYTVRFTLPEPFAPFLAVAGVSIMPKHKYAKAAADGTLEATLSNGAKPEDIVGTGPFILKKVELGQRILLERNPLYRKVDSAGNKLPYLDAVSLVIVKEPNQQMLKFKSGEIDQLVIQGSDYPILKPLEKEKGFSVLRVGPSWYDPFFTFNQNNQVDEKGKPYLDPIKQKWFRTKEFRQACAYAVSYEEIQKIIYNGLAYPPAGIWGAHKGKFHNPNARSYSFNAKMADSLLTSIGMIDRNGDGVREDSDGNPVEFTLTTSAGVKLIEDTYSIVRKDLQNIGIKVHLDLIEFNTLIERTSNTFNWDVVAFAMGGINDPHFGKSSWSSNSFRYNENPQRKKDDGAQIPKNDRDYELSINTIFEKAATEMDVAKRTALYAEWQMIEMEQCHTVYMPLKEVILGVKNRFGNIHYTANLGYLQSITHNIDEIFILK